jgi:hypothetical protein
LIRFLNAIGPLSHAKLVGMQLCLNGFSQKRLSNFKMDHGSNEESLVKYDDENEEEEESTLSIQQRRMDQLAYLLEGSTTCSAACNIGNTFLIASNALFKRTREDNQSLKHICTIMEYFKAVAKDAKLNSEARCSLMESICRMQIKTLKGAIQVPPEYIAAVIPNGAQIQMDLESLLREQKDLFKKNPIALTTAFAFMSKIFPRVRKIENSILKAASNDFSEISSDQLQAFKNFSFEFEERENSFILLEEVKQNVHAEAQILTKIIEMALAGNSPLEVYIGISKRCCSDCNDLLLAADNVLFEKKAIHVKFEGSHGASFEWTKPSIFDKRLKRQRARGEQLEQSKDEQLQTLIWKGYERRKNESVDAEEPYYNQQHPPSDSEASLNLLELIEQMLQEYEKDLKVY